MIFLDFARKKKKEISFTRRYTQAGMLQFVVDVMSSDQVFFKCADLRVDN